MSSEGVCFLLIAILGLEAFISAAIIIALKKAVDNIKINLINLNTTKKSNDLTLDYLNKSVNTNIKNIDNIYKRLIELSEFVEKDEEYINSIIGYLERKYNEENGIIEVDEIDNKEE